MNISYSLLDIKIFLLTKLTVIQSVSTNSTTQNICNIYKENMINHTYSLLVSINKIGASSSRQEREMKNRG